MDSECLSQLSIRLLEQCECEVLESRHMLSCATISRISNLGSVWREISQDVPLLRQLSDTVLETCSMLGGKKNAASKQAPCSWRKNGCSSSCMLGVKEDAASKQAHCKLQLEEEERSKQAATLQLHRRTAAAAGFRWHRNAAKGFRNPGNEL